MPPDRRSLSELQQCDSAGKSFQGDNRPYLFPECLEACFRFLHPASSLVKLQLKENEMLVSAQDIDFSTSAEEKIVCSFDGTELSIGFKATYLIEILSNINSEEVILKLADPSRAGLIVPSENEENKDLLMLLMPMMLND